MCRIGLSDCGFGMRTMPSQPACSAGLRISLMEAIGPILLVVAIPFMLRLVPPNRRFGLAIPVTLRDRSIWYDINARWGRNLFALGAVLVMLEFVLPRDVRIWTLRIIASIGFVSILIDSWRTAIRMGA